MDADNINLTEEHPFGIEPETNHPKLQFILLKEANVNNRKGDILWL